MPSQELRLKAVTNLTSPSSAGATNFIVPVWGKKFVSTFLDIGLRSCLTQKNFATLPNYPRSCLRIMTNAADAVIFESDELVAEARHYVDVEIVTLENLDEMGKYAAMSRCHSLGMSKAPRYAYNVFLTADAFLPDGVVQNLLQMQRQDAKVVMGFGLCVKADPFAQWLRSEYFLSPTPQNVLLKEVFNSRHEYLDIIDIQGNAGTITASSHLIWLFEAGFITHANHLHPIMVAHPESCDYVEFSGTIDGGDFIEKLGYRLDDIHVVCNYADLPIISLDNSDRSGSFSPEYLSSFAYFLSMASGNNNEFTRNSFRHKIFLDLGGRTPISEIEAKRYRIIMSQLMSYEESVVAVAFRRLHRSSRILLGELKGARQRGTRIVRRTIRLSLRGMLRQ